MTNRQILILGAALFGLAALLQSFYIVDERERVLLFQFGEILGEDSAPGVHFKIPFVQNVVRIEKRIVTLDSQPEEFLTSEKKNVKVDYYAKWRVTNTPVYYRATGGQEIIAMDRLSAILNRAVRDEFGVRTIQQAVSGGRDEITRAVQRSTADSVRELGIELVDVRVKRIDLPDDVSESVYQRMRAERQRVASDFRARGAEEAERIRAEADRESAVIVANAYRDAERIRGEGDAGAAEIYAQAYGQDAEFYQFYRSLQVYREAWGGQNDVLVLEPKGELFKYFSGPGTGR
jgi:modulator of FtsH protease HflC